LLTFSSFKFKPCTIRIFKSIYVPDFYRSGILTLASVVVADLVGGAVGARVAALLAHPVDAHAVGAALLAAAANRLAHALGSI
jgi:hypothetical protein